MRSYKIGTIKMLIGTNNQDGVGTYGTSSKSVQTYFSIRKFLISYFLKRAFLLPPIMAGARASYLIMEIPSKFQFVILFWLVHPSNNYVLVDDFLPYQLLGNHSLLCLAWNTLFKDYKTCSKTYIELVKIICFVTQLHRIQITV